MLFSESRTFKVIAISSGRVLTNLASLVLYVILARMLSTTEYAIYRQALLVIQFSGPILMLALPQAIYYLMPSTEDKRSLVFTNLMLLIVSGAFLTLFLLLGGNNLIASSFSNPALRNALLLIALYPILLLPVNSLSSILVSCGKATLLAAMDVSSKAFVVVCVVITCIFYKNATACIIALVLSTAVVFAWSVYIMLSVVQGKIRFAVDTARAMFAFSLPVGISALLGTVSVYLDKLIVSTKFSPEVFSIYVNGATQIPLTDVITGSVTAVILAEMSQMVKNGEHKKALELFKLAAIKCASVIFPIMVFFFFCADLFMVAMFSETYRESAVPFRLYLLQLPLKIIVFGAPLMAVGQTGLILKRTLVSLVLCLVMSLILVEYLGYIGPIIGTIVVLYSWNVSYNLVAISRAFHCSYFEVLPLKKLGYILAWCLSPVPVLVGIRHLLPNMNVFFMLGIEAVAYFPFILGIFLKLRYIDGSMLIRRLR